MMNTTDLTGRNEVVILQRLIPAYRVAVFRRITESTAPSISLLIGESLAELKTRNADDLSGIAHRRLPARAITLFGRIFTWHKGLIRALYRTRPDVILCEAESHFLGYVSAILYRIFLNRRAKLVMWCFYALPGIEKERSALHAAVKKISRRFFDGFISYSSYGRHFLISQGFRDDQITVAVNVCDTDRFLTLDREMASTRQTAKEALGSGDRFIVSYVGTLDPVKRPDLLLDISKLLDPDRFQFFIIGSGQMEQHLAHRIEQERLGNVRLTGKIGKELPLHYRASDLVIVPGRGGIVISEAMCFGVPVLVHQADGVELDLIVPDETGVRVRDGSAVAFAEQLARLADDLPRVEMMGANARRLINERYNTRNMADAVVRAVNRLNGRP